ncbi:30S ribosomal protein S17 [Candidatus Microgenomates bacterium]|nr:30S ribosomal protein S17 [Candidatus Microgenomates bacterium]
MIGRVVSTKTKNTATVLVERQTIHPLYKKTFIRSKKYLADDQVGVKMGDIVEIEKVRPISKNKHFRIIKVLGRSLAEIAEEQMKEKAGEVIAEVMPQEGSENSENSENQNVRRSDSQTIRSSGTQSASESSEKKRAKRKKETK